MARRKKALSKFHQESILKAAESLFIENGITKTTMDDIAKRSVYSKATIYVYFKDKEEIINYIVLKSMKLLCRYIKESVKEKEGMKENYYAICNSLVDYGDLCPFNYEMSLREINIDIENPATPDIFREIYDVGEEINEEIARLLYKGIQQKIIRPELQIYPTVFFFWASLSGIIKMAKHKQKYIEKNMKISVRSFLDYSFDTLLQSVIMR